MAKDRDGSNGGSGHLTRREFIVVGSLTAAAVSLDPLEALGVEPWFAPRQPSPLQKSLSAVLRRPEDQLVLEFDFYNLVDREGWLRRLDDTKEGWVVVKLPPQHVLERAYRLTDDFTTTEPVPAPGLVDARLAGPSRLAFVAPVDGIPFTAASLLGFGGWVQKVTPAAVPAGAAGVTTLRNPRNWETAIEAPWFLLLSPSGLSEQWDNRRDPLTYNDRTELWHTNYVPSPQRGVLQASALRAVWTRHWDLTFDTPRTTPLPCSPVAYGYPFESPLVPRDRAEIVISTSEASPGYTRPRPLDVDRLSLSSFGGSLDIKGQWNTVSTGLSLESWAHRATFARDQYVRIVRVGFLFPLGHRAVEVEVTERRPEFPSGVVGAEGAAYLRKRTFIVVRQPVIDYQAITNPFAGRAMPFEQIRLLTTVTPNISKSDALVVGLPAYFPMVGSDPFVFEAVGTDYEGRQIPFSTPLVFVEAADDPPPCAPIPGGPPPVMGGIYHLATLDALIHAYNDDIPGGSARRPDISLGGRPTAFAEPGTSKGSTTFEAKNFRLWSFYAAPTQAGLDLLFPKSEPPFIPVLEQAEIRLGPAESVAGSAMPGTKIGYNPSFVAGGFGVGEVWALTLGAKPALSFDGGRGGGVVTPNLAIGGLSRKLGPVGSDPAGIDGGSFTPAAFFAGASPKLLGGISLADVIATGDVSKAPVIVSAFTGTAAAPKTLETRFDWHPDLKATSRFAPETGHDLTITGRIVQDLATGASKSSLRGDLRHVSLLMIPGFEFIKITFNRVAFVSETGKKTEFVVDIDEVEFRGALSFIGDLAKYIKPPDGAPSGPFVDVGPSKVIAGMAFALPTVAVGAFVLENISTRTEVRLPLNGDSVTARFGFSTRDDPFHLTVLGLGGGGFCAIEIGSAGPKALDVSLEFGAMVALNLGVAKGKVEAFGGLYYRLDGEKAVYEAFVRLTGSLRVLGLVTVSAKFYVSLKYDDNKDKFHGTASITYSIDMGLFEKDVSVKVERKFPRKSGDPFLTDRVSSSQWDEYCQAYAVGV